MNLKDEKSIFKDISFNIKYNLFNFLEIIEKFIIIFLIKISREFHQ